MIKGFSKLTKEEKQNVIQEKILSDFKESLSSVTLQNSGIRNIIDNLSENVVAAFPLPYSIAPNFLIDEKEYFVPMVTEESSVVAAASKSAGFWYTRGGFHTEVIGTRKYGQVHFTSRASIEETRIFFEKSKQRILESVESLDRKMVQRGGGIQSVELIDMTDKMDNYYQINVGFETCNAMGANYMNSCLEAIAGSFTSISQERGAIDSIEVNIIMSILSNYSPESAVRVYVECPVEKLSDGKMQMSADTFSKRFAQAVRIAEFDVYRAVTHNKGLYNGVDAVALATGNDWRAIEANGHAYASSKGGYSSLTHVSLEDGIFHFEAIVPFQTGTTGGITKLHPLTQLSLRILQSPGAEELMKIMASAGLASNFAAIQSLITTGIQKGHMKMHLNNILLELNASKEETELVHKHFKQLTVSYSKVEEFINILRNKNEY